MALLIKAVGKTFTKYLGIAGAYPVRRGLVGAYYLGSSETDMLVNHAGGSPLTVVGTPTVNPRNALVGKANGYDTGLPETSAFTWIAVAKKELPGTIVPTISNFNDIGTDTDIGCTLSQSNSHTVGSYVCQGGASTSIRTITTAEVPLGTEFLFGVRCSGTTQKPFKSYNGVITHDVGTATGRGIDTEQTIAIGHHHFTAGYVGTQEVYAAIIHNVELTDQEVIEAVAFLRARYAELGVPTL